MEEKKHQEINYPNVGELVLIKIKKVFKYGAFVYLEEFPELEGYLPISEIASRWIKNIHEFVSVGQRKVARVYHLDHHKNQIDISIKRVSESDKKRKIEDVRRNTRAMKLFDIAAKNSKIDEEKSIIYMDVLINKYGDIYSAMSSISEDKENALNTMNFPKLFSENLIKIASENMKKPVAVLNYFMYLTVYEPKGVEIIKKALAPTKIPSKYTVKMIYAGAPRYNISFTGPDYKNVDRFSKTFFKAIEDKVSKYNSEMSYEQIKKS
jgi:translation initiation factor 2 subunit 1